MRWGGRHRCAVHVSCIGINAGTAAAGKGIHVGGRQAGMQAQMYKGQMGYVSSKYHRGKVAGRCKA